MLFGPLEVRFILGVFFVLFTLYWMGSLVYDRITSRSKPAARKAPISHSHPIGIVIVVIIAIAIFAAPATFTIRVLPISSILGGLGILIALVGMALAVWARRHLGGNWSGRIMIKQGQTVTKTGPYALVRHPIYGGLTIWAMGSWIALGDLFGTVVLIFVLIFCIGRIVTEERLMQEAFGKEYADYRKKTKVFIPFIY